MADTLVYTIEVDDKASNALQTINKTLRDSEQAFKAFAKAFQSLNDLDLSKLKGAADVINPLIRNMQDGAAAVSNFARNLNTVGTAAQQTAQQSQQLVVTYDAFTGALVKLANIKVDVFAWLKQGFSTLGNDAKQTAEDFKRFFTNATDPVYLLQKAVEGLSKVLTGLGSIASAAFDVIIKGVKKAWEITSEFVMDSVKAYANFETALNPAARTMGLTKDETAALGVELQKLSLDFTEAGLKAGVSSTALAEIAGVAGQMGFSFRDNSQALLDFTAVVAKTSIAFEMSVSKTAESLGILTNVFNYPIDKVDQLAGAFAMLGAQSQATVPQLLDFAKRIGPVFSELGGTAEQAAAIGAVLRDVGISTEVAGTAVTQILTKMQTSYTKFEEVLKAGGLQQGMLEMKLRSGDAVGAIQLVSGAINNIAMVDKLAATQAMTDLGIQGFRSLSVMQALSQKTNELNKYLQDVSVPLQNAAVLNKMYATSMEGMNKQLDAAKNAWQTITQVIGKELAQAFTFILEKHINPFLAFIAKWLQDSPAAQALFKAIGDVIKFAGEMLGILLRKFQDWLTSLSAGASESGWFTEWLKQASDLIKSGLITALNFLLDGIPKLWAKTKKWLSDTVDDLKQVKESIKDAFGWWETNGPEVVLVIESIIDAVKNLIGYVSEAVDIVKNVNSVTEEFFYMLLGGDESEKRARREIQNLKAIEAETQNVKTNADLLVESWKNNAVAIDDVTKQGQMLGNTMYGNSVLPDMVTHLGLVQGATDSVSSSFDALGSAGVKAGNDISAAMKGAEEWNKRAAASLKDLMSASQVAMAAAVTTTPEAAAALAKSGGRVGTAQALHPSLALNAIQQRAKPTLTAQQQSLTAQLTPTRTPAQQMGAVTNINISGPLITDERSMDNLATVITRKQSEQSGRILSTGGR